MFIIQTYVAKSDIEGLGVFTAETLKKGQRVWTFHFDFDRIFTKEQLERFPKAVQEYIWRCGYIDKRTGYHILGIDHDSFMNHSDDPNLIDSYASTFAMTAPVEAARDITAGEELTQNYYEWDDPVDLEQKFVGKTIK